MDKLRFDKEKPTDDDLPKSQKKPLVIIFDDNTIQYAVTNEIDVPQRIYNALKTIIEQQTTRRIDIMQNIGNKVTMPPEGKPN